MSGIFQHSRSIIDFAWQLVKGYEDHNKEQDRITRAKKPDKQLKFTQGRWFSDDHIRHGKSSTTEYTTWSGMKQRCYNENHKAYQSYGGRGVRMCNRWLDSFPHFLKDMGKKPAAGMSIDRIDNDGNYEPGNCRWVTASQQMKNRRCSGNIIDN